MRAKPFIESGRHMPNAYNPQCHFVPEKGWINDPNGLVYFQNTWHLFFQYYEPSQIDGMQWGHATSTDLINWEHLDPAISPDRHGQIWSGSAVVDHHDSSGLFNGAAGIVCLFTYWDKEDGRQSQGLSYSSDGIHFTTYAGNPIIPQLRYVDGHEDDKAFRDPKVFWHAPTEKWVMVVAGGHLRIFTSENLIDWQFESFEQDIYTECPDLFELAIDGDESQKTWVLSLGGRAYMLGDFDGKRFTPTSDRIPMSFGPDFYAGQSWSDAPDNRRIMISWLFAWHYGSGPGDALVKNPFPTGDQAGSCLSLPYELLLRTTDAGTRLIQKPIAEVNALWDAGSTEKELSINGAYDLSDMGRSFKLHFTIDSCAADELSLVLATHGGGSISCGYDKKNDRVFIDRSGCGFKQLDNFAARYQTDALQTTGNVQLEIIVDACSIEIFINNGAAHISVFALIEEETKATLHGQACLSEVSCQRAVTHAGASI